MDWTRTRFDEHWYIINVSIQKLNKSTMQCWAVSSEQWAVSSEQWAVSTLLARIHNNVTWHCDWTIIAVHTTIQWKVEASVWFTTVLCFDKINILAQTSAYEIAPTSLWSQTRAHTFLRKNILLFFLLHVYEKSILHYLKTFFFLQKNVDLVLIYVFQTGIHFKLSLTEDFFFM